MTIQRNTMSEVQSQEEQIRQQVKDHLKAFPSGLTAKTLYKRLEDSNSVCFMVSCKPKYVRFILASEAAKKTIIPESRTPYSRRKRYLWRLTENVGSVL